MKSITILFTVALVLIVVLGAGCTDTDTTLPQNQSEAATTDSLSPAKNSTVSPAELVAFVERAYEYAHVHGQEAALREFNDQNGQFVDGELYIFAYDLEGNTLALPFQPELIGTNRWNITDENGIAFIQDLAAAAKSDKGFSSYLYVDPADEFTVKQKLSYVMMVDKEWFIGAGIYDPDEDSPVVRIGTDPQIRGELESFVGEAIEYARTNGKDAAIAEFNDRNGTFIRDNLYIYAFDYNGTTLALPYQPQLLGTDLSGLQDPYGVNYTRVEILLVQQGGGFIFYHYYNPAHDLTIEPKMSYVQKVDDTWWLGAGIYLSDVKQVMTVNDLAEFVEDASEYAVAAGEQAALSEFSKKDGQFSRDNVYIYAYDYNGTLLAHPYQPEAVGTNRLNWSDARGLPMIRIAESTASNGGGFIAYLYPAPEDGVIDEKALDSYEPKIGYVAPAGENCWIGSGIYFSDMVSAGSGRPEVISEMIGLVEDCAVYGREEGSVKAFAEISNQSGMFVDDEGHYIYAYDYEGTLLAHPYLPELIGSNLIEKRDQFGMETIRALAETARSGGGYVVFIWPNPDNENMDELKIGYVLPVNDTWWVGSGVYLSEITGEDSSLSSSVSG
ncbi:cache domain-containing protein [Methanolobus sediminis]|uniref:Cache domain-containing protein n=1 Tax=Methanolobus sediminis TaxID=3072978 RepID=A0AA51YK28_9EURY|nr:cache domain-containing protein [Methanolobus sediminis]WMW26231.1 cache domain-containing protein [Methanolobus sediminis]